MTRKHFLLALGACVLVAWACGDSDESHFIDLSKDDGGIDGGPYVPIGSGDGAPPIGDTDGSPPVQGNCKPNSDAGAACQFDTYCDPVTNTCVPFGEGQNNANCRQVAIPGNFAPKTKCEFPTSIPITGDPFPDHVDVQATPLVARFGKDAGAPSIVAPFTKPIEYDAGEYTEHLGVLRILKGTDCTQEAVLGGIDFDNDGDKDWFRSSASPAIGDLDGDGIPEIVAFISSGATTPAETLMAFTIKSGKWEPLWATKKATNQDGTTIFKATVPAVTSTAGKSYGKGNWASPSIHDLDDDGVPEIIREGWVFDGKTGKLRANPPTNYKTYRQGEHPVLANLDDDARIELTNGASVWEFDGNANVWVEESYYDSGTPSNAGWAAIADFDPAPPEAQVPEIAVAASSNLTIFTTKHTVFKGMSVAVPGGGGGPPTIADFDGDGLPEVAIAGQAFYTVFDPDCQGTPRTGGKCDDRTHCEHVDGGVCPDKILWSRATQDNSSNVTGSSVFDFEADGKAEVVYADECFTRVYSGTDGTVLFSRYRSSCTWNENPIVADVDGDFRAELVVGNNTACGDIGVGQLCRETTDPSKAGHGQLEPGTDIDSQFIGLRCLKGSDCISGMCDRGFCRCASSAECCADKDVAKCETFGTKCATPPAGTPGTGKTCRANHPKAIQGIRVYEDANDQWVRSRSIWNQHAYAVTNVNEDGTIPKTSQWLKNWTQAGLNNFRQNVPGTASAFDIGDLTSQSSSAFACNGSTAVLATPVCNRGTAPIGAGVSVGFYVGALKACGAKTKDVLQPGKCESVTCDWVSPPSNTPGVDVMVIPNDDGAIAQCDPNNDKGLVKAVFCTGVK